MKKLFLLFLLITFVSFVRAEQRSSVSQYGITWYFESPHECGQFITGDWWVVGPVTIINITPQQAPGINGSVLNLTPEQDVIPWDDQHSDTRKFYDPGQRITLPLTVSGLSALSSTKSVTTAWDCIGPDDKPGYTNRFGDCTLTGIQDFAVLTIVENPVPAGTFRPSYMGGSHMELINISSVDFNVLPRLPLLSTPINHDLLAQRIERPALDHCISWANSNNRAADNHYSYGRDRSDQMSITAVALMQDIPNLELLATLMIQRGIDLYQGLQNGAFWPADGGHASGRKWPILFAGKLLNHQGMLNIGNDYGPITFGEDCQTYYTSAGDAWWGSRHCQGNDDVNNYRNGPTSPTWVGQMITAMALGLRDEWNHEAYFDYVDRWIDEGGDYNNLNSNYIAEFWNTYRDNLPAEIPYGGGGDTIPPTTPTGLAANTVSGSSFNLSWNASTDNISVTNYDIYIDGSLNQSVSATLTSASISGLTCNTTYAITVQARDAYGNLSGLSNPLNVTTSPVCNPVNVAQNKTIINYSAQDAAAPATNLVDGDISGPSRWSANGYPQYAEIDLGADYGISQIDLYTYQNRAYQYTIEGKTDGGSYNTIVDRSSNTSAAQPITNIIPTTARYIKITVTGASGYTGTWVSLTELMVYDMGGGTLPIDPVSVSIAPTSLDIDENETAQLMELVLPPNATDKSVKWTSSNPAVATVTPTGGLVTGIAEGSCTITATTNVGGLTANCPVTVSKVIVPTAGTYYCDPVNGSMSNNGSESSPWSSLEAAINAGKTFDADDIIYLLDGNHGYPVINNVNPGNVTITRYAGANPEIRRLVFSGAENWTVDNVKITSDGQATPEDNIVIFPVSPLPSNTLVYLNSSEHILIRDCDICSVDDNSVWTTTDDWNKYAWNGIMGQNGCNYITILGCHIKNINFGFSYGAFNLLIKNNIFENFCGDGVQFGSNNTKVEGNTIINSYQTNENHYDMIQFSNGNNISEGTEIRGNTILNYTDPNQPFKALAQGIVFFENMHSNCIVENNMVAVDSYHGITINGATNCQIINNTAVDINNTGIGPVWIQVLHQGTQQSSGNIVRNNICNTFNLDANIGIVENNITVPWADYNTYFTDYANNDYSLIAGSPAIDAGTSAGAPSVDINGVSRPQGAGYDVGAYEYTGAIIDVTGVTLTPETLSLEISETANLTADPEPTNATNQSVTWESSNPDVAVVNNGTVVARAAGTAIITATTIDGGYTDNCTVTVTTPAGDYNLALLKPVTVANEEPDAPGANLVDGDVSDPARWSAEGFPQSAEIDLGEDCNISSLQLYTYQGRAYQYTIEASTDGANYATIVDRSSNTDGSQPITDAVTVSARHIKITVTGASGYTGTWVSLNELIVMGTPAVITIPVTGVSLNNTSLSLEEGETAQLLEDVQPPDANDKSVSWTSSNESIATVNINTGLVTAVAEGSAVITVTTTDGGYTATCDVTVTEVIAPTGWPDETTTGTTGTLTPYSGNFTVTTNGQIVENLNISGGVIINANNALIRNCKFGALTVPADGPYTGTVVEDCELLWAGVHDFTLRRCKMVRQSKDLIRISGPNIIAEDCYMYCMGPRLDEDHSDIFQEYPNNTGSNIVVRHNTLYIGMDQNAIFQNVRNALIENNLIAGGGWCIFGFEGQSLINNHFSTKFYPSVGYYGPVTNTVGCASGNVIHETGQPVTSISSLGPCSIEPVTGVLISPTSLSIDVYDVAILTKTISPPTATDQSVVWSTSDSLIATVNSNGGVLALSEGSCTITVTTNDGGFSASCSVTVLPASGNYNLALLKPVNVTAEDTQNGAIGANLVDGDVSDPARWSADGFPQTAEIDLGEDCDISSLQLFTYQGRAYQYTIEASTDGANYSTIVDRSSNTSGAQPIVDAVSTTARHIKITVTGASGYTGTWVSLNELMVMGTPAVSTIPVTGVLLNNTSVSLEEGETAQLLEDVQPPNANDKSVSWSSSNPDVASVDPNTGLVTAVAEGNAVITVTTNDGSYTATCDVTVTPIAPVGENLALGKPVTVDSEHTSGLYPAENAVDGNITNPANRWLSASGYPHYIEIDLELYCDVEQVNFWTADVNGVYGWPAADYQIQYWDGSAWQDIVNVTNNTNGTVSHSFATINTNKVKLYVTRGLNSSGGDNDILRIMEIQVWGTISNIQPTSVTVNPTSISLDEGETYQLVEDVQPANANDKSVSWLSSNPVIASVNPSTGLVTAESAGNATITATTNVGGLTATCDVTVTPIAPVGENLALGKPVTVDSEHTSGLYPAENAVDGNITNPANRWLSASGYPHYIEIDLEQYCDIYKVNFWTADVNGVYGWPAADYQIQYWDGSAWQDIVNVTNNTNGTVSHSFATINTNKVKLYATRGLNSSGGDNDILRIMEIQVWGTISNIQPSENLALNKPVITDSELNASYNAENAIDGDNASIASRWLSDDTSYPHWIEIDLDGTYNVSEVNFWTGYYGYGYPINDYQIQYLSGSNWVDAVNVSGNNSGSVSHTFPAVTTNKIRLYCTAGSDNIVRLFEIEVWGEAAEEPTVTLNPIADAYVRGGSHEGEKFGTESTLYVKEFNPVEYTRKTYLKFDLSSVSTVNNAFLRLYVNSLDGNSVHSVAFVSNDNWTETGITYISSESTMPAGSSIDQWNVTAAGQYIEADITSIVASEAGGLLSLQITSTDGQYIGYDSREGANPPELVINDPAKSGLISKNKIGFGNADVKLALWPNPVSLNEPFNISFKNYTSDESFDIRIFDISGKMVFYNKVMDASGNVIINPCIKSGIYILNITNKRFYQNNKLIVE